MNDLFTPTELDWIDENTNLIEARDFQTIYENLAFGKDKEYNSLSLNVKIITLIQYLDKNWEAFIINKPWRPFGWYSLNVKMGEGRGSIYTIVSKYSDRVLPDPELIEILVEEFKQASGKLKRFKKFVEIVKEILTIKLG